MGYTQRPSSPPDDCVAKRVKVASFTRLLLHLLLLLFLVTPSFPAAVRRRRTGSGIHSTPSRDKRVVKGKAENVMLSDEPRRAYYVRGKRIIQDVNDTFYLLSKNQLYLSIRPNGSVLGVRQLHVNEKPQFALLKHEVVESSCITKNCAVGQIVTVREVTSHNFLCVNKKGRFYGQKFLGQQKISEDCWFVQMNTNGFISYYSATHGNHKDKLYCNVTRSHVHQPGDGEQQFLHSGDAMRLKHITGKCRKWFVSLKDNGELKKGQRSKLSNGSKFLVISNRQNEIFKGNDKSPIIFYPKDTVSFYSPSVPSPQPPHKHTSTISSRTSSPHDIAPKQSSPATPFRQQTKKKSQKKRRGKKNKQRNSPKNCPFSPLGNCNDKKAQKKDRKDFAPSPTSVANLLDLLPLIS